jgi:hypothetical protein
VRFFRAPLISYNNHGIVSIRIRIRIRRTSTRPNGMPSEAEKYNKSNRLPVECGFCDQPIPPLTEEVKCMACKKNWDRTTVHPSLTQHTLIVLKHRRKIFS